MDLPLDWNNIFDKDIRTQGIHFEYILGALIYCLTSLGKVYIEYISSIIGVDYKTVIQTLKGSFTNEEELTIIKPIVGGGTDFQIIFEYINKHMKDKLPASIIILTDGFTPFPKQSITNNIPVLWLLNNNHVTPLTLLQVFS